MIHPARVRHLNALPVRKGRYVLYWMQSSQRAQCNHALELAVEEANALGKPLLAVFGLTDAFPRANLRHYAFMLQGLRETAAALQVRGVRLAVRLASPEQAALGLADDACMVVCDRGYTRVQRQWRERLAAEAPCRAVQVESDAIVPIEAASDKAEYAAATLRPKIRRALPLYLAPLAERPLKKESLGLRVPGEPLDDVDALLGKLNLDRSVGPVDACAGGYSHARELLDQFVAKKLARYDERGNDPGLDGTSRLSPYLHFGQISPLEVALAVQKARPRRKEGKEAFLEQLVVRRELALNFAHFDPRYDSYACLPDWARKTLAEHRRDKREYLYDAAQLERAETHDPYWNAAQQEMVLTGRMHNYMRMYWGKKILEWTESPEEAFGTALALNDKYELDGRDPNGFAGVAWVFGKHDRPWKERPVFGKVRYMNANGLRRKFDMEAYVGKVERMESVQPMP